MGQLVKSYSQLGQDQAVAYHFDKRDGYFVDVGAFDGVTLSNTYALERELGWRGVCVEPLPAEFAKLRAVRSPSTVCYNVAAASVSGQSLELAVAGMLSGDVTKLTAHAHKPEVRDAERIHVLTLTLTEMLDKANAPSFIEFMSLDTEGSELDVLQGLDFSRYRFGYLSIEHNFVQPMRTQIRTFLASKGYKHLKENRWDDDFVPQ